MPRPILVVLLTLVGFLLVSERAAHASADVDELVARARELRLARSTEWRRLLLYKRSRGRWVSLVDGASFFAAPNGKSDPEAELEATLRAFFVPVPPTDAMPDEHALCRFPARRIFLESRLPLAGRLPSPRCPALARYEADNDAEAVSIVYAAAYVENPSSAFGHTLLRLKKKKSAPGRPSSRDDLDVGVDYTAETDTKNPILYAFKGVGGYFPGRFRFLPWDDMLHQYAGVDARDLWEYELALEENEVRMLLLHLRELATSRVDYLYLTENCSYQIVAAVEAAAPRLSLVSKLKLAVLPIDTLKAVTETPGLVRNVVYRPSVRSVQQMTRSPASPETPTPALPPAARSDKRPDRSHDSMRVSLGTGITSQYGTPFASLGWRLALHDLLDPPRGNPELTQLTVFDVQLRFDYPRKEVEVARFMFLDLVQLNPLGRFEKRLSWRVRAFGERIHDRGCLDCFHHGMGGAVGATIATRDERLALFAMADARFGFSGSLDGIGGSIVRVGVGPYGGARARIGDPVVVLATAGMAYLPGSSLETTFELRAGIRARLAKNVAMGFEGAAFPASIEGVLATFLYY